jgi:hypothetical protein
MSLKIIYYNFGGEISKCCIFKNEENRKSLIKIQRKKLPIVPFFKLCSEEKIIFFLDFSFIFLTNFFFSKLLFFCETSKSQIWTFLKCPKSIFTTSNNAPKWVVPFFRCAHSLLTGTPLFLRDRQHTLSKERHKFTFRCIFFFLFYKI